jgi:gliding motility-associated lipoprotein GldH
MRLKRYIGFFAIVFLIQSCNTLDVYEKTAPLPRHEWLSTNRLPFTFELQDSLAYYNFYFVIRHTESYHYNNIWLDLTFSFPTEKPRTHRFNIQLANSNNGWLGTAMDDIIEQRLLINKQPLRLRAGTYQFTLQQIMREDPLQNVLNAGLRVEKVVQ